MKIMVINGPNLNMVGVREKGIYGTKSFEDICDYIEEEGKNRGHEITLFQSNCEGEIIDQLQ
ncbi:MAG TPA: type II 3-dehydroquinate dehydratase, partial [Clostridium sp.]